MNLQGLKLPPKLNHLLLIFLGAWVRLDIFGLKNHDWSNFTGAATTNSLCLWCLLVVAWTLLVHRGKNAIAFFKKFLLIILIFWAGDRYFVKTFDGINDALLVRLSPPLFFKKGLNL